MNNIKECRVELGVDGDDVEGEVVSVEWTFDHEPKEAQRTLSPDLGNWKAIVQKREADHADPRNFLLAEAERVALGSQLFRLAVPNDQILRDLRGVIDEQKKVGGWVRIALVMGDSRLEDLPWELLRDPDQGYLGLLDNVSIVRVGDPNTQTPHRRPPGPLLIRYIDAGAVDQGPKRELKRETWATSVPLSLAVDNKGAPDRRRVTFGSVRKELVGESDPPNVFHFTGHGSRGQGEDVALVFSMPEGHSGTFDLVGVDRLGPALSDSDIYLAVLPACQAGVDSNWRGFGAKLLTYIPAVVSMQAEITDGAARAFCEQLYQELACGLDLDHAVARGRERLAVRSEEWCDWWVPMLHHAGVEPVRFPIHREIEARVGRTVVDRKATISLPDAPNVFPYGEDGAQRWEPPRNWNRSVQTILSADGRYCAQSGDGLIRVGSLVQGSVKWLEPVSVPHTELLAMEANDVLRAMLLTEGATTRAIFLDRSPIGYCIDKEWDNQARCAVWNGSGFTWLDVAGVVHDSDNPWGISPEPDSRLLDAAVGQGCLLAAWVKGLRLVVCRATLGATESEERRYVVLDRDPDAVLVARTGGRGAPGAVFVRYGKQLDGWAWTDLKAG